MKRHRKRVMLKLYNGDIHSGVLKNTGEVLLWDGDKFVGPQGYSIALIKQSFFGAWLPYPTDNITRVRLYNGLL